MMKEVMDMTKDNIREVEREHRKNLVKELARQVVMQDDPTLYERRAKAARDAKEAAE